MKVTTISSIRTDRDHDLVMIDQYREEIISLETKIKYFEGKIDATNNILEKLEMDA